MDEGVFPPETGSCKRNKHWYQIDAQLVNEIWGVFYPGMIHQAAERAEWGARITNDSWGTHPAIAYAAMFSAATFISNVDSLVLVAHSLLPDGSPFKEGIQDVLKWHRLYPDWRIARQKIHEKYYQYSNGQIEAPVSVVSSLQNGLCGILTILYGEGHFLKTASIAVSAGYDCDNQAATCAGLIAYMNGASCIPSHLLLGMNGETWWPPPSMTGTSISHGITCLLIIVSAILPIVY